ncbi:MAG: hypothetical protein RBT66_09865 [bacterium]|jgi:hypothetical protein|nr:hypothetical protein [bacterium]
MNYQLDPLERKTRISTVLKEHYYTFSTIVHLSGGHTTSTLLTLIDKDILVIAPKGLHEHMYSTYAVTDAVSPQWCIKHPPTVSVILWLYANSVAGTVTSVVLKRKK